MKNWWSGLGVNVILNEPMKKHTSFRIGGPARFFALPKDSDELKILLKIAKRYSIPVYIIGGGSNILVSDSGIRGMVIRLKSSFFNKISGHGVYLEAGSGVPLARLMRFAQAYHLFGLEFLAGIPGTLGGALVMNAGIAERSIGDCVENVTVMDYNGRVRTVKRSGIGFAYRTSRLQGKYIVLGACLKLGLGNHKESEKKVALLLKKRKTSQDYRWPSAGCVFKNPRRFSAGELIDRCGLKGSRRGDAFVSNVHANFIVNKGKARSRDVLRLMGSMKEAVLRKYRINLEPEIKVWQN
jgi:UDP-N-acetylmuramate dehydrogenase